MKPAPRRLTVATTPTPGSPRTAAGASSGLAAPNRPCTRSAGSGASGPSADRHSSAMAPAASAASTSVGTALTAAHPDAGPVEEWLLSQRTVGVFAPGQVLALGPQLVQGGDQGGSGRGRVDHVVDQSP